MKQKGLRKLVSMILAVVMVLAMSATAFAATITIENTTTNKTYTAYKIFDATADDSGDAVSYTITSDSKWYSTVYAATDVFTLTEASTTNDVTTYYVTQNTDVDDADVIAVFSEVPEGAEAAETKTGNGGTVTMENLDSGYYYITTTNGSAVTISTTTDQVEVIDKNQTPSGLNKTVDGDSTVKVGDTLNYTITANVPAYNGTTKIEDYVFTDVLSAGLTLNSNSITVKILDANGDVFVALSGENYITVSTDASTKETTMKISYNPTEINNYPADATIRITYTATVNSSAEYENSNTVTSSFDETGSTVTVYTYGFNLKKVDANDEETVLENAEFQLTDSSNELIYFLYDGTKKTYTVVPSNTDNAVSTITAGEVVIFGLDAGTYTLTETKAPDGYNLAASVNVVVGESGSYDTATGINTGTTQIEDSAGSTLPSTGGIGTTIFYIIGGVLVLGAAVLFVTKKRLGGEN